ncbi:hypothetical protein JX265_007749 [Neoarthrinium moseri]|uniref:Hydrophobic surface binding protein n=1 Tax=Neoarthrinium moseri TaxID=1658444 RepID=A0A9P9WJA6_9PEZI|nr:uncharacterized protein JN550_003326 [Neoarthrinium moseri]KAI1855418.1 hypothetical protein JX266_000283 [Neoarthrinium moseri]KAI1866448.1 hypothetical protein JX265_007749 [Neoarthrinium moseri]KAI1873073.1 hypothetical protein JN550_003326 [Neoarthrinium moseri]
MVKVASIALFATAVLGAVIRRDVAETLANLQKIDASVVSLTTTVRNWDGSVLGALGIQTAATTVGNNIDSANSAAADETVASSQDSATLISFISQTGEPNIATSLDALVGRKADFQSAGVSSLVLSTLRNLKSKNDAYGATLLGLTAADQKAAAQTVLALIVSDFNEAITAFS